MYKHKNGVFLARMQPLHVAHMFLVEKAMDECETVHICLGSSNKKDMIRNPFTVGYRRLLLEQALLDKGYSQDDLDRVHVFELPDWSFENDSNDTVTWGRYFYYNVVSRIEAKRFAIYYSDDSEIINGWFNSEVRDNIHLRLFDRSKQYDGLSATKVRQAIIDKDMDYLREFCPQSVINQVDYISRYYRQVLESPDNDFSME